MKSRANFSRRRGWTTSPPSLVAHAQQVIQWLARAIVEVDQDTANTAATIADSLGHMLALPIFANTARNHSPASDE
jgi:hypothetical protein